MNIMSNQLYFYKIGAYGYEDNYNLMYGSYNDYSQEEFEEILFKVLEKLMNKIIEKDSESLCYYNIFFQPDDLILHDDFNKYLFEEAQLFSLSKKAQASVNFELDGRYENKFNERLNNTFLNLDIDTSCHENDCSRIVSEEDTEKEDCKKNCGVTLILNNKKRAIG